VSTSGSRKRLHLSSFPAFDARAAADLASQAIPSPEVNSSDPVRVKDQGTFRVNSWQAWPCAADLDALFRFALPFLLHARQTLLNSDHSVRTCESACTSAAQE
jgi:hypothetical protein